jgi:hypothetical protein
MNVPADQSNRNPVSDVTLAAGRGSVVTACHRSRMRSANDGVQPTLQVNKSEKEQIPRRNTMAKTETDLFKTLRARGVRKKVARQVTRATSGAGKPKVAKRAMADLSSVVGDVSDRLRHGPEKRSAAARKAARTRKQKARRRSEAAERGARTRARP